MNHETLSNKSPEHAMKYEEIEVPKLKKTAEVSPEQQAEQLETARAALQEIAAPKERLALPVDDKPQDNQPLYLDRTVKNLRLKQSFKQVRQHLPAGERALSKVVHQPVIRAVSEVGARTITRPSGLLGGGLLAFTGSLAYLLLTKYVGMPYNYLVSTAFFVGGFALGLLIEFVTNLVRPKHAE